MLTSPKRRPGPQRPRKHPESALQISVVDWLNVALLPAPDRPFFTAIDAAIPLPPKTAKRIGGIKKAMGTRAGTLDMLFVWRRPFFIEFKAGRNGTSPEQDAVIAELKALGVETYVCRNIEQVEAALRAEGVPLRRTLYMTEARKEALFNGMG